MYALLLKTTSGQAAGLNHRQNVGRHACRRVVLLQNGANESLPPPGPHL